MSAYAFGHPMVKRPAKDKPELKPMKVYFKATMVCPDCDSQCDVMINRDAEVYHECNEGNVRSDVPKMELPEEVLKYLHKSKFFDNLTYVEKVAKKRKLV